MSSILHASSGCIGGCKKSFRPRSGARSSRGTTQFVCSADLPCAVWGTPRRFLICFLGEGNSVSHPCLAPSGKSLKKAWTEPFPSKEISTEIIPSNPGLCKQNFQPVHKSASDTGIAGKGKEKQPADRGRLLCSGWRLLFLGAQNTGNSAKNTACNLTCNFTCCSRNGSILNAADQ